MSLLVSLVFPDVVQIVPANDERSLHLHALNNTSQDTATNRDIPSEWTLFVNICSLASLKVCVRTCMCAGERGWVGGCGCGGRRYK